MGFNLQGLACGDGGGVVVRLPGCGCSERGVFFAEALIVPTLQRGHASTSACSSFGSPRIDEGGEIQTLHFLSGPRRFPQKVQAGFHGRVALETINLNSSGEFVPAVVINKLLDNTLKSDSMEGVLGLLAIHPCSPSFARWSFDRFHAPARER